MSACRRFRGPTTDSAPARPVAPNLLERDFSVTAPNVAWVGTITYLPFGGGWAYLAVLIDLYSRKAVGWALEEHLRTELCLAAVKRAVADCRVRWTSVTEASVEVGR